MTELKLFTTPQEEMELAALRSKVSKIYADAFTQIKLAMYNTDNADFRPTTVIYDICAETIRATDALAQQHLDKWKSR
jgi:mRNA-degrading endonuclease HigB of HigAB toxin-antitoxin module